MLKTKSHRITERFKLEETSGSYLVQSSCSSRDKAMIFLQISISDTQKDCVVYQKRCSMQSGTRTKKDASANFQLCIKLFSLNPPILLCVQFLSTE